MSNRRKSQYLRLISFNDCFDEWICINHQPEEYQLSWDSSLDGNLTFKLIFSDVCLIFNSWDSIRTTLGKTNEKKAQTKAERERKRIASAESRLRSCHNYPEENFTCEFPALFHSQPRAHQHRRALRSSAHEGGFRRASPGPQCAGVNWPPEFAELSG